MCWYCVFFTYIAATILFSNLKVFSGKKLFCRGHFIILLSLGVLKLYLYIKWHHNFTVSKFS